MVDARMSVVIEYHTCTMQETISQRPSITFATWQCTHINLDGQPCRSMATVHGLPSTQASSHVTSSEAITARFKAEATDGPKG